MSALKEVIKVVEALSDFPNGDAAAKTFCQMQSFVNAFDGWVNDHRLAVRGAILEEDKVFTRLFMPREFFVQIGH